jgi:type II secretory pathway pseudopilin PulG
MLANNNMRRNAQAGFSLLEAVIAMGITLAVMAAASTLLATSLRIRSKENTRSDALAAAQRALNMMSREIGNSGYGLNDNGIVLADSSPISIRVRANLTNNDASLDDPDEDVRYVFQSANGSIVRFDNSLGAAGNVVLASNVSSLTFTYMDVNGATIANPANYNTAERLNIDVRVDLPAGPEQPASTVRLLSDVTLRNAPNTLKRF